MSLEEALLGGRFLRYAWSRMSVVALNRGLATVAYFVEFTILFDLFARRSLVVSLVSKNLGLIVDGLWWGALEVMRRRLRADGKKDSAWRETSRWLSWALWGVLALAAASVVWLGVRRRFRVLDAYVLVCVARTAIDLMARTFYSGVWARQRVYRPLYSILLIEPLGIALVAAGWRWLGPWSFPAGLLATVLVSRGIVFAYSVRAYRAARLRLPRLSLRPPPRRELTPIRAGELTWAALGNLSTRVGSALALAFIVRRPNFTADLDPFPYIVQFAVPLLGAASSWSRVFYHDLKRLEATLAARLSRKLEWRLVLVGVGFAAVLSGAVAILAVVRVDSGAVAQSLLALGPLLLTLSVLSALQLRALARGGFARLFAGSAAAALAMVAALWLGQPESDVNAGLLEAIGLAAGIAVLAFGFRPREAERALLSSRVLWLDALRAVKGEVSVGSLRLEGGARLARLAAERLASLLKGRATFEAGRVWWFTTGALDSAGLARATAGLGRSLRAVTGCDGQAALASAISHGLLRAPEQPGGDSRTLVAEFRDRFPDGIVAALDAEIDARLARLPPRDRQQLWRDACARADNRRARLRTPFDVTTFRPQGEIRLIFGVPRERPQHERSAWRARVEAANWKRGASV